MEENSEIELGFQRKTFVSHLAKPLSRQLVSYSGSTPLSICRNVNLSTRGYSFTGKRLGARLVGNGRQAS